MPTLDLHVVVEMEITRIAFQGSVVARPVPRVVRDDAATLYEILSGLDHSVERFRERRRLIARLTKLLRPFRRIGQGTESETDKCVGTIDVTQDALEFLNKIFSDPPEDVKFAGVAVETAMEIEDALDATKKKSVPDDDTDEPVGAAEDGDDGPD